MTDIKVLSRDEVKVAEIIYSRADVELRAKESFPCSPSPSIRISSALGWREILRLMDAYEKPANPFTGLHWEKGVDRATVTDLFLRVRDVSEELTRIRELMAGKSEHP